MPDNQGSHNRQDQSGAQDAAAAQADAPDAEVDHESWVNQHKHEPMPASRHADQGQGQGQGQGQSGQPEDGDDQSEPAEGKAVRDMMGGAVPQGDVPDAPATQVAATFDDPDKEPRARYVANAVPGKPDGEVDTRS
ncbi:MAG TPA: hypothetical protein VGH27_24640 [Streptosporangiaceae bacterium]|jgi:hypothetical protein